MKVSSTHRTLGINVNLWRLYYRHVCCWVLLTLQCWLPQVLVYHMHPARWIDSRGRAITWPPAPPPHRTNDPVQLFNKPTAITMVAGAATTRRLLNHYTRHSDDVMNTDDVFLGATRTRSSPNAVLYREPGRRTRHPVLPHQAPWATVPDTFYSVFESLSSTVRPVLFEWVAAVLLSVGVRQWISGTAIISELHQPHNVQSK